MFTVLYRPRCSCYRKTNSKSLPSTTYFSSGSFKSMVWLYHSSLNYVLLYMHALFASLCRSLPPSLPPSIHPINHISNIWTNDTFVLSNYFAYTKIKYIMYNVQDYCVLYSNTVRLVICEGVHFNHLRKSLVWLHHFTKSGCLGQ